MLAQEMADSSPPDRTVFISNIEHALDPNGVTGSLAKKVLEISPRAVWYGDDTVVLPARPDPAFLEYAASLGREPKVVIPTTIDPDRLTMRDGFNDPNVQHAVRGQGVSYYMGSRALYGLVTKFGGHYEGGDPGDSIDIVNNKERYAEITRGIVDVVPNELADGVHNIARAVQRALDDGKVYVRHTKAGGGLGNRTFIANGSKPNLEQIISTLNGDQPDLWRNGKALVEPFKNFVSSPAVTFQTDEGRLYYDNRQITNDNDYIGLWSPMPDWEVEPQVLEQIGNECAARLGRLGFRGIANTDLGLTDQGELYGFEFNGRTPGSRHKIRVGEIFLGPWENWRKEGVVIKSLDKTYLKGEPTFRELKTTLDNAGLLATPENPFGAVITIPPAGNIAGIQVHGKGYRKTEELHRRILSEVGHPTMNVEDHPIALSLSRMNQPVVRQLVTN